MKDTFLFEGELAEIPPGTFVVTFWGRVGLFVRFTGKRGRVQFGAHGPSAACKCLRYATQAEVNANLPGVNGLVKEQTS